jgi:hypothetical protein
MKKIILILTTTVFLFSCKKEEIQPNVEPIAPVELCNCGTIYSLGTSWGAGGLSSWVKVMNECSGNFKTFWVSYNQNLIPGTIWCETEYNTTW